MVVLDTYLARLLVSYHASHPALHATYLLTGHVLPQEASLAMAVDGNQPSSSTSVASEIQTRQGVILCVEADLEGKMNDP